jgi:2-polyprenyl-6-methoxyphenol hydroxylase-like FAD-dependent oxidoreductase
VSPVIIVGGGIGGLAAAVALQVRGIPCVVYGASPVTLCPCLQPIGARHPVRRLRA